MTTENTVQAGTPLKVVSSPMFQLNWRDVGKGAITAALTAATTGILRLIEDKGSFNMADVKIVGMASLAAFVAYLLKNLFTEAKVVAKT